MLKQGWQWYYRKYIDVHRGGIGGISMLLTRYCVLCYIWNYPYLKKERWRMYHHYGRLMVFITVAHFGEVAALCSGA